MKLRGGILHSLLPVTLLSFSACAHTPLGPDSLAGKNFAAVQSEDSSVRIALLDGHRVDGFWKAFTRAGSTTEISLTPGDHVLYVCYFQGSVITSSYYIKMTAEAGHVYLVNDEVVDHGSGTDRWHLAKMWIVDRTSAKIVGDIVASWHEPITKDTQPFRQSMFFAWSPPGQGDWSILSRNAKSLIAAIQDGSSVEENSNIIITVEDLPSFDKPDDLLDYFKKLINSRPVFDPKRFEDIETTVKLVQARNEECVYYERVGLNKHPHVDPYADSITAFARKIRTAFQQERPLFVEVHGYACRIPNNRNLSIDFRYSRWSFDRQNKDVLSTFTDKSFAQLKF